jgi:drug/metabolite transporter (DMT)-like permease
VASKVSSSLVGALLVAAAALLWAADALFRYPTVESMDATFIVFAEHVIGVAVLVPWIFLLGRGRSEVFRLSPVGWGTAAIVGAGGSALATVIFTASFQYVNPSVAILLQKLQPVMVVLLAFFFLGERPAPKFYGWALVAVAAALILSFPDLKFDFVRGGMDLHSRGVLYSLAAAGLWAVSTVAGKALLRQASPTIATFWRFAFGLLMLALMLAATQGPLPWRLALEGPTFRSLLYMGLIAGLLAMICYYAGMRKTTASITTFVELLFPVGAVLLNAIFLHIPFQGVQAAAGTVLLFAVTMISL